MWRCKRVSRLCSLEQLSGENMRVIEVVVNPDGSMTVKYNGFMSRVCFEEAKR